MTTILLSIAGILFLFTLAYLCTHLEQLRMRNWHRNLLAIRNWKLRGTMNTPGARGFGAQG